MPFFSFSITTPKDTTKGAKLKTAIKLNPGISDDGKVYLLYKDVTSGQKKVELI